jgi:hypothetical protein
VEVGYRLAHGSRDVGRHFDHRLEELSLDPLVLLAPLEGQEDLVDPRDELVALPVQDLELFLDPQAEGCALAEILVQLSPSEKLEVRCRPRQRTTG